MSSFLARLAVVVSLLCSGLAGAVTIEVIGPCSEKPPYRGELPLGDPAASVGAFTLRAFDRLGVPYVGNERGMNSILGTPTGTDAYEVLDARRMRVYGWCYSVNGKFPPVMADEVRFESESDHLLWIFGFTTYDNGEWIGYCDPAHEIRTPEKQRMFCGQ